MDRDLKILRELARAKGVGFSLVFEEASDEWYFTCESAAPTEGTVSKSGLYETTIDRAKTYLLSL